MKNNTTKNTSHVAVVSLYSADIAHALGLAQMVFKLQAVLFATEECDASDAYKQAYIHAREEDIQIIQSPVGMPGRALRNEFIKNIERERQPIKNAITALPSAILALFLIALLRR